MIRYLHDCGGIHAAGPAWDDLGFECVGITEIEKFPIAVVKHHYPNLTQYGNTTKIKGSDIPAINLLVGGTPCQGFSVAGKRGGLDDERSGLAWNFLRLAAECHPRWIVWENVPGASSTNEGQDLLAFVTALGKLGYGFAWRTLDAQHFGVPQRRRRIFLVGNLGDWRFAAAVLFESHCLRGNIAPRRKTGEGSARCFEIGPTGNRATGGTGRGIPPIAHTITTNGNRQADHSQENYIVFENHAQDSRIRQVEICPQLNAKAGTGGNNLPLIGHHSTVRRLTPLECERLQGFPDDWTNIPNYNSKRTGEYGGNRGCPDGPRYKALGNAIAVPVLRHIGKNIITVERLMQHDRGRQCRRINE